ncbi:hypothetical protein LEP1GSC188_2663 [Leptospira weilii serovar Topaz str. LT2116]|uniref:Uncharacterized protein n=1 Tax=Leptospira weilii serovar Topaz str. LT2116 TaxID=1088540 RepID=M3FLJ4_9LEPT|nr:hypothetical protein LEP1GSC188_2663 [Leptospira weilii serovar Topaz str. LT2116]
MVHDLSVQEFVQLIKKGRKNLQTYLLRISILRPEITI